MKTFVHGNTVGNRKGYPKILKTDINFRWFRDDDELLVFQWKDKNNNMVSSFNSAEPYKKCGGRSKQGWKVEKRCLDQK